MKTTRQDILEETLKNCHSAMTRGETQEYTASDADGGAFYTITPQQMANWDYIREEWDRMDFHLLAGEIMENCGF